MTKSSKVKFKVHHWSTVQAEPNCLLRLYSSFPFFKLVAWAKALRDAWERWKGRALQEQALRALNYTPVVGVVASSTLQLLCKGILQ